MQTVDASPTRREELDPIKRQFTSSDVMTYLAFVRYKKITKETFRQWRKVAQVTSTHLYTAYERKRLALVARHLLEGGKLKSKSLKFKIKKVIKEEEKWRSNSPS